MRALLEEEPFKSRLTFTVYPWEHEQSVLARTTYEFGRDHHGLVVLAPDGRLLSVRPGHNYGAEEIREDLEHGLNPDAAPPEAPNPPAR